MQGPICRVVSDFDCAIGGTLLVRSLTALAKRELRLWLVHLMDIIDISDDGSRMSIILIQTHEL